MRMSGNVMPVSLQWRNLNSLEIKNPADYQRDFLFLDKLRGFHQSESYGLFNIIGN